MSIKVQYYGYKIIGNEGKIHISGGKDCACVLVVVKDMILIKIADHLHFPKFYFCDNDDRESLLLQQISVGMKIELSLHSLQYLGESITRNEVYKNRTYLYCLKLLDVNEINLNMYQSVRINEFIDTVLKGAFRDSESIHSFLLAKNKGII